MPQEYLEDFVEARFRRGRDNDDEIISSNIEAMRLGRQNAAESGFVLGDLASPNPPDYQQLMLKGNEAIALGATHAGLQFYAGYPISARHDDPALDGAQPGRRRQVRVPGLLGD